VKGLRLGLGAGAGGHFDVLQFGHGFGAGGRGPVDVASRATADTIMASKTVATRDLFMELSFLKSRGPVIGLPRREIARRMPRRGRQK